MAFAFSQRLYEEGVFVTPVVRPAVPEGCAMIRTSYMASHCEEELDTVLQVFEKLGQEFNIIGNSEKKQELDHLVKAHYLRSADQKAMG